MLTAFSELRTYRLTSTGTAIGRLDDVVFPRGQWTIRYLEVWSDLLDRQITLPIAHVGRGDRDKRTFAVDAEPSCVEASSRLDVGGRIAREDEQRLYEHYGWPPYWLQAEHDVTPIGALSGESEQLEDTDRVESASPQLQSASQLIGIYTVHTNEEELGVLQGIVVDDVRWTIPFLAVATSMRDSSVLVQTARVGRVDWISKDIFVTLPTATLIESPAYTANGPLTPDLERSLRDFYDR